MFELNPISTNDLIIGITGIIILIYTYYTYKIAKAATNTLDENLRPIVSCELISGKNYYSEESIKKNKLLAHDTRCIVTNHSKYNVEVFVNLNLKIDDKKEKIDKLYSGEKAWPMTSFQKINGHFNPSEKFNLEKAKLITLDLKVEYQSDSGQIYKIPTQNWHYDLKEEVWVNDIGLNV